MRLLAKASLAAVLLSSLLLGGCNEVFRPIATPLPVPGGDPNNFDIVGVINQNPDATKPSTVTFIDATGDTNIGNKQVGNDATFGTWDNSRSLLLTANTSSGSLTASNYSMASSLTVSLEQGAKPTFIGTAQSGLVFVINSGATESCPGTPSLGVVSTTSMTLQRTVCLPGGADAVSLMQTADSAHVLVVDRANDQIIVINPFTATIENSINVGTNPVLVVQSPDRTKGYVLNQGSNDITVIDMTTLTAVPGTISTGGTGPISIDVDARLNRLWVVNGTSHNVTVFDASQTPIAPLKTGIPAGAGAKKITVIPDGSVAFVANTGTNTVTRISGLNFSTMDIPVSTTAGATVTSVASSRDGSRAYATVVEPTNMKNGTAILKPSDTTNPVITFLAAPQQDTVNCDPTKATCPLQRPIIVVDRQ